MTDNNIPSKNTFSRFFRALLSRLKEGFNWFANLIQKLKNTPKSSNSSSPESSISPVYRGDAVDILPTRGMNTPDNTAGTSEELIPPQTVQNSGKPSEDLMDASNDIPNRMNDEDSRNIASSLHPIDPNEDSLIPPARRQNLSIPPLQGYRAKNTPLVPEGPPY